MGFITKADKKRAFKTVVLDAYLSSQASGYVENTVNKCVSFLLTVDDVNKYINQKKYGKLAKYLTSEVNAAIKRQTNFTQQINFSRFVKKVGGDVESKKMITIAVVAEYLMCDLFDKGFNTKLRNQKTITKDMILEGLAHDNDLAKFCKDFM